MDDFERDLAQAFLRAQTEADALADEVMETIAHGEGMRRAVVFGAGFVSLAIGALIISATGAFGALGKFAASLQWDYFELGADLQSVGRALWTTNALFASGLILLSLAGARALLRDP